MAAVSLEIIREFLTASGTDFFTSVGDRIDTLGNEDEEETNGNTQPFMVMTRAGGQNTDRLPVARPAIQMKIYSGTGKVEQNRSGPLIAARIYEQLKTIFHDKTSKTTASGFIVSSFEQQPPQDVVSPKKGWPFVLVFYDVMTRDLT